MIAEVIKSAVGIAVMLLHYTSSQSTTRSFGLYHDASFYVSWGGSFSRWRIPQGAVPQGAVPQ